jgi:hypothetical protein
MSLNDGIRPLLDESPIQRRAPETCPRLLARRQQPVLPVRMCRVEDATAGIEAASRGLYAVGLGPSARGRRNTIFPSLEGCNCKILKALAIGTTTKPIDMGKIWLYVVS